MGKGKAKATYLKSPFEAKHYERYPKPRKKLLLHLKKEENGI